MVKGISDQILIVIRSSGGLRSPSDWFMITVCGYLVSRNPGNMGVIGCLNQGGLCFLSTLAVNDSGSTFLWF